MNRLRVLLCLVLSLAVVGGATAQATAPPDPGDAVGTVLDNPPPTPDPAWLPGVQGGPCTPETEYEQHLYGTEPLYEGNCERITFTYGPIVVKPGQMDAPLEPVTIEKPAEDGFIVRFKPDLVYVDDGGHPRTDQMHLHHATWINAYPSYGDGPFFAAGEEKTIANFPQGYGMEVGATDQWLLLYMVHNALATTERVWITYEIDFVTKDAGEELGIAPVKPFWLDVQKSQIADGAPSTSANPVFNVQRGFGHIDSETGRLVCRWPDENCADFDVYGNVTPQQGDEIDLAGQDIPVRAGMEGTLIGLGGHMHPGGIRDEVALVRDGVEKDIFISDAIYWDPENPGDVGGPPNSWNLSMTATGAPLDWKVKIREGDYLRINTVQDSQDASWYENMGIVVAFVAPEDPHDPPGVDVFDDDVELNRGVPSSALTPDGLWLPATDTDPDGWKPEVCHPNLEGPNKVLCLRGQVTHGPVAESGYYGGCPDGGCQGLPEGPEGPEVTEIVAAGFTYTTADMGVIGVNGIPRVQADEPIRFVNAEGPARIPHTFTRCQAPCTGETGVDYPIANGGTGPGDPMDFDSTQISYGLPWEPFSGQVGGDKQPGEIAEDGIYYEFTPTEPGTYTFYCRIHPNMRGAFEVIQ